MITEFESETLDPAISTALGELPKINSDIKFLLEIFANPKYFNQSMSLVVMSITNTVLNYLIIIVLISVWISIAISQQKMGAHDMIAKTSVVDLNSVTDENNALIDYENNYKLEDPQNNTFGPRIDE